MSALPDDPGHLVDWLRAHGRADATPADFVPRADYGSYLAGHPGRAACATPRRVTSSTDVSASDTPARCPAACTSPSPTAAS